MHPTLSSLLALIFLTAACSMDGDSSLDEPPALALEVAFPNLSFERPVDLQHPGDGSGRLFVLEQAGRILVFPNDSQATSAEVFLDIRDRVLDDANEQGLLGLAFHPDFEENGYFFVDYTAADPQRTVIARYQVNPSDPNQADESSEMVILEVEQPYGNHNAGQIVFGPEGFLFITFGDGGDGGDPHENGQDPTTLLASILRIDVDHPSNGLNYGIPPDNPFADRPEEGRPEIYAWGLRNPWRISFDPETGQLWTGDVGQNSYEEIDIIEKGGNYGWNTMEGTHCYDPSEGCDQSGLALPVWEYGRSLGQSVTGGFVYRGSRLPALQGKYVYADYATGRIWALTYKGPGTAENELLLDSDLGISSFGVDADGELYVLAFDGKIYRFRPAES